jgi:hypothetical protein
MVPLRSAALSAEGNLDFRGMLGVANDAPVGFAAIRLAFAIDFDAPQERLDQLQKLAYALAIVKSSRGSRIPRSAWKPSEIILSWQVSAAS